jgi:hypothetical protein
MNLVAKNGGEPVLNVAAEPHFLHVGYTAEDGDNV